MGTGATDARLLALAGRVQACYHLVGQLSGDVEPDARVIRLQDELFAVVADLEALAGAEPSAFTWPSGAPIPRRIRDVCPYTVRTLYWRTR